MNYKNRRNNGKVILISGDQPRFDGNTFSVRTEPGAQASKLPEPIPLLGGECPYVDVRYEGNLNLADNTVPVAALDQDGSEWRKIDAITMELEYHYLGLGFKADDHNNAYNKQFRITQEQALSSAYASQMTELEYMGQKIQSDVPEMDGIVDVKTDTVNDNAVFSGSGQFADLVWYQSFLQNIGLVMGKYNTLRSFKDYLLKMGYNAESTLVLRFMNLLEKQNVWTVFDQLGNILTSQFFDLDFWNEITAINAVPCRKYNEVGSPLISITGSMIMPEMCVYPSNVKQDMFVQWNRGKNPGDTYYTQWKARVKAALETANWTTPVVFTISPPVGFESWSKFYTTAEADGGLGGEAGSTGDVHASLLDKKRQRYMWNEVDDNGELTGELIPLQDLIVKICDALSPYAILKWARSRFFPLQSLDDTLDPAKTAINKIIYMVGGLVDITSHFRSDTVDLLTFLKVMQNSTAMNHWVLDTPYLHPANPRVQVSPTYFKLIYDILTSYGTSGEMVLDDNTRGWDIFTWWHASEGIPKYDAYDGGFTMAAAIRGIPENESGVYDSPPYMIPLVFNVVEDSIVTLNRRGSERPLGHAVIDGTDLVDDPVLAGARLMDVPASISIPVLSFAGEQDVDARDYSQAIRCLNTLFGVGKIVLADNTAYEFMDPKMEGFIGRTYSNANSMALTYINGRAPFRTSTTSGGLGFSFR